jgi:hypothetical protein
MNHPGSYFASVFVALLSFSTVLILVARAREWKPRSIKPAWAALIVLAAAFVAGSASGIAGKDIHMLCWWLLGVPLAAVFIASVVIVTNLFVRLVLMRCFSRAQIPE